MRSGLAAAALLALAACAPEPATPQPVALDCAKTFEALSAAVLAQPGLEPAPKDPAEPYRFYRLDGAGVAYVLTEPGAPGHPAIFRQDAAQENGRKVMKNTGCPYGDRKGYEQVLAYLGSLSR